MTDDTTTQHLLIRQRFESYPRWREGFESMAQVRADAGLRTRLVALNAADPREVVVLFAVADPTRARAYLGGDGLADAWRRAGVIPESSTTTVLGDPVVISESVPVPPGPSGRGAPGS